MADHSRAITWTFERDSKVEVSLADTFLAMGGHVDGRHEQFAYRRVLRLCHLLVQPPRSHIELRLNVSGLCGLVSLFFELILTEKIEKKLPILPYAYQRWLRAGKEFFFFFFFFYYPLSITLSGNRA